MKDFWFSSAVNPLAARRSLVMLRGHRVPLPAGSCVEPMMRGCNQRELLEKFVKLGLRHLVVPLNGPHEDTCLFARRHPGWGVKSGETAVGLPQVPPDPAPAGAAALPEPPKKKKKRSKQNEVLYDLEHRDEGAFTRLKFLLDAAEAAGVMLGFSLFSAWPGTPRLPLSRGVNVQGITLDDAYEVKKPEPASALPPELQKLEAAMRPCIDWIAAQIRNRGAVWVQIFRGIPDDSGGADARALAPLRQVEASLAKQLLTAITRPGEEASRASKGPWVAPPFEMSREVAASFQHVAPFDVRRELLPERNDRGRLRGAAALFQDFHPVASDDGDGTERRPALCAFAMSDRDEAGKARPRFTHQLLWRTALSGAWPIVPGGFENRESRRWFYSARMADFFKQWSGRGYIRPCPEILAPMPRRLDPEPVAATDGCGRYMVFFEEMPKTGVELATPPGNYRYYWLDPVIGRLQDSGDGLAGGERCRVPEFDTDLSQLLILEQEELPDPMSVW